MDASTLVMLALSLSAFVYLTWRSGLQAGLDGSREGLKLFMTTAPRLFFAFAFAGMLQVLLPREIIARWLSDAAGFRGIMVASVAGAITPGGPFLQFPVVAGIYSMGAGVAPIVAYLTAWSLMGVHRIVLWELPFLGARLTFTRVLFSLPLPLVIGFATRWALQTLGWPRPPL
ncbi:MAG: permease [Armatimonadota bacterium]|nr:permease [Armatimonadota bacterium]MDR7427623.1 permease [Armatimonadota bacterium]MDR7464838.1 permease [Armatimonadota bacterium]MDR7469591.1 permease [Armatimonadota bacterium]MDR7538311.1 permease [Armatimonadota bacterium]